MPKAIPGSHNVFIPGVKASGNLFVDFSRNLAKFPVLRYAQPVPVENTVGVWFQMGLDERARITDSDLAKFSWADGMDRPDPNDMAEYFEEKSFRCQRRSYADRLGKMMTEQAHWNERERRERSLAQKAMTARTIKVLAKMTDSGEYDSSHVADLSSAGAITGVVGNWASSTAARLNIKRTLNYIKKKITLDTRGAVESKDLVLVMSPETAEQISVTQEIVELVKNSNNGMKFLRADEDFPKENYGLPPRLYNTEVIIEDTVKVTSQRSLSAQTAAFALPLGTVVVAHRPGSLEGVEGGRSFSTCSIHIYREDDMKVESDSDNWNRVEKIAVTDNFDVNMTAPVTGFLLQNVC